MKVSIVVFEINEIDGMKAMMPQIKKEWYDELIVVDGGSTDGTLEYCRKNGYDVFVQQTKGVGAAMNEGVKRVTGDIIILYAPDGSFLVEKIPVMIELLKDGNDLVNVSRYCQGAKSLDDSWFTGFGNRMFSLFAKLFMGWQITDFLYTYLGFKRELINELKYDTNEWTWGQRLLLKSHKANKKIVEIPGDEPRRIGGEIKMPKFKAGWVCLKALFEERFSK
jgi:glycosyltransferase involved in cell wall biosynthesis